jgi:lipooligosaccharide transport system permease protein
MARAFALRSSSVGAIRVAEYHATTFRHLWRATLGTAFFTPFFYLAGMGLGLGRLVNEHAAGNQSLGGVSYVAFLAPGLLAADGMLVGSIDSTWPVLASLKWNRSYYAMTATPLRAKDVVAGHILWMAVRVFLAVGAFAAVMMLFKDTRHVGTLAAVPAGVLTGLAVAAPIMAWACTVDDTGGSFASFQRFVITPMFLFSGTFFSVDQLPPWLRVIAWFTPLFHGVSLCRGLALGGVPGWQLTVHVVFLVALLVVGVVVARRTLARRLYP